MAAASDFVALDPASMRLVLHTFLTTMDNAQRRECEIVLVRSLRDVRATMALVQLLRDVPPPDAAGVPPLLPSGAPPTVTTAGVRQLSAVLLRRKFFSLWRALGDAERAQLQAILLQQLEVEPARTVRLAIAHVVSVLAKSLEGQWPELMACINRLAAPHNPDDRRELAMVLTYAVAEVFDGNRQFIRGTGDAIVALFSDPRSIAVRLAALRAVSVVLPFMHGTKTYKEQLLQHVVPAALETVRANAAMPPAAAAPGAAAAAAPRMISATSTPGLYLALRTLELVEQLVEDLHSKTHAAHLAAIANAMLALLRDATAAPRVREHSSEILALLVETKPKFVKNTGGGVPSIVDACFAVMAEDNSISLPSDASASAGGGDDDDDDGEDDGDDDADDDDDLDARDVRSACMYSARLLSVCAKALPAKLMTGAIERVASAVFENPRAAPREKKAAIIALACLAEGNPGHLRRRVAQLLHTVETLLRDADAVPREAASFALMYFCGHLQPEILTHHARLMPMLVRMLDDPHDVVRARVAATLDALCENLADDLNGYVPTLVPKLVETLRRPDGSLAAQEALVSALSSVAQTNCPAFAPFAPSCLELLKLPLSTPPTAATSALRAKATEAAGIVALCMGKEAFAPHLPFFFAKISENLAPESAGRHELREQSFGFLASLCELLGRDFLPHLGASVDFALKSLETDNAQYRNRHLLASAAAAIHFSDDLEAAAAAGGDSKSAGAAAAGGGDDGDDDDAVEADSDDLQEMHMRVRTADVEEKSSAVYAIGVFAATLRGAFPRDMLAACWATLMQSSSHFHPSIRSNAVGTLMKLTIAAHGDAPVVAAAATAGGDALPKVSRDTINTLLYDVLLPTMSGETEKDVVASACEALCELLQFFGAQTFVHDIGGDLCRVLANLLRCKAPCQNVGDDDEDDGGDEDDEDGDHDREEEGDANYGPASANHSDVRHAEDDGAAGGDDDDDFGDAELPEDHDHELSGAVMDVLDALAAAYGAAFAPYFHLLAPHLLRYLAPGRPSEDFVAAGGTLANCLMSMGPAAAPYAEPSIALALRIIGETDESSAKANCCFIFRAVAEHAPGALTPAVLPHVLQALSTIIYNRAGEEIPAACDNAVSAACSILRVPALLPPAPRAEVAAAAFANVPMKVDKAENANAMLTLVHLLDHQRDILSPSAAGGAKTLVAVLGAAARIFQSRAIADSEKAAVRDALGRFNTFAGDAAIAAAVRQLPQSQQHALQRAFSG